MTHTLEARLTALEQRANRYRTAFVSLALLVVGVVLVGATTDDGVIEGRKLVLHNDEGQPRVVAGIDSRGNGSLSVRSRLGSEVFLAGVDNYWGHGGVKLRSGSGTDIISLGTDIFGAHIAIKDFSGLDIFVAGADTNSNGLLMVTSRTGAEYLYVRADENGNGLLTIDSEMGSELLRVGGDGLLKIGVADPLLGKTKNILSAGTTDDGFLIEGYNKTGEGIVQLYADEYGNGVVGVYNRKGEGRTLEPGP